jgi:hypothetical protein
MLNRTWRSKLTYGVALRTLAPTADRIAIVAGGPACKGRVSKADTLLSIVTAKGYSGGPVDRLISGVGAACAGLQAPA